MKKRSNKSFPWSLLLIVGILTLAIASVSFIWPFGRDQGIYAFVAQEWLNGKILYQDLFIIKPPLNVYTHSLALILFGHAMVSIRILDFLFCMGIGITLCFLTWEMTHRYIASLIPPFLFLLSYYSSGFWDTAQTDGWTCVPISLSIILTYFALKTDRTEEKSQNSWNLWFLSGFCIALGVLFKYTIGFYLIGLSLYVFFETSEKTRRLKRIFYLWGGFFIAIFLIFLHFTNFPLQFP